MYRARCVVTPRFRPQNARELDSHEGMLPPRRGMQRPAWVPGLLCALPVPEEPPARGGPGAASVGSVHRGQARTRIARSTPYLAPCLRTRQGQSGIAAMVSLRRVAGSPARRADVKRHPARRIPHRQVPSGACRTLPKITVPGQDISSTERRVIRERPAGDFSAPDSLSVMSCDIPEGMTIADYRQTRTRARPRRGFFRRRSAGGA
jgi:hypothetical protein